MGFFIYESGYQRETIERHLLDLKFKEEAREVFGEKTYRYYKEIKNEKIFVNLTSPEKGTMQIQTNGQNHREELLSLKDKLKPDATICFGGLEGINSNMSPEDVEQYVEQYLCE